MRCSIIRRVSSKSQEEGFSIADQLKACQKSIADRKWTFVKDFNFAQTHGYDLISHPLYAELKQHVINNECDVILVSFLDRALRDTNFWKDFCKILQDNGKLLASPSEIYDPRDIEHEFSLNVRADLGHYIRKRTAKGARDGMASAKDNGQWLGGTPPLGYDYIYGDKKHPLKINQTEADAVRAIVSLIQQKKYTRIEIVKIVNDQGFRTKTRYLFTTRTLRRIIEPARLLFYSGQRYNSKGEIITANWEPIISLNDYQNLLGFKFKQMPFGWSRDPKYLLTGLNIFKCGYCGHSVKTTNNRHKCKGGSFYYYCSGYYKTKGFCQKSKNIKMDLIDKLILSDIKTRLKNLDIIEIGYQALLNSDADTKALANFNNHLSDLDQRKANLIHAIEFGTIPLDDVKTRLLEIDAEHIRTQAKINDLNKRHEQFDINIIKKLSKTIDQLEKFNLQDKREIIKLCIESIKLYQTDLYITYRFPIREDGRNQIRIQFIQYKDFS